MAPTTPAGVQAGGGARLWLPADQMYALRMAAGAEVLVSLMLVALLHVQPARQPCTLAADPHMSPSLQALAAVASAAGGSRIQVPPARFPAGGRGEGGARI